MFQHSPETLIDDLLGSIPTEPNIAAMEKAEQDAAAARRPKWDVEQVDIDELMAKTVGEGEIDFAKLSRGPLMSKECSESEIRKIAEDALRRLAGTNDDLQRREDDIEDDPDPDDEPAEIPADDQVKADVAFLKSEQARGRDIYDDVIDPELHKDYERGKQLAKAAAYMEA